MVKNEEANVNNTKPYPFFKYQKLLGVRLSWLEALRDSQ